MEVTEATADLTAATYSCPVRPTAIPSSLNTRAAEEASSSNRLLKSPQGEALSSYKLTPFRFPQARSTAMDSQAYREEEAGRAGPFPSTTRRWNQPAAMW